MSIPTAIPPFYKTKEINQPVDLYEGPLEVTTVEGTFEGTGTIQQRWLPEPAINIDCKYKGKLTETLEAEIGLPGGHKRFAVLVRSHGFSVQGSEAHATLSGLPNGMVWGSAESIKKLRFHIPNFSWFRGAPIQHPNEDMPTEGRATFSTEDWVMTIESVPGFKFGTDIKVEDKSGHAITHVGELVKQDGSSFSVASTESILMQIFQWLSFCRGNWVAPILSVGFDESGQAVWKDWRQWNIRRSEHLPTWVNRKSAESLEQSFPGFCARYKNVIWARPIKQALAWYVECNRRASGLEASIILCQTALELLGWASLVQDHKVLSQKGFNDLPAADKIRLLVSRFDTPLTIPSDLPALRHLAKAYHWSDGPECLVGIRNALVHPQPKNMLKLEQVSSVAFYEVWNLGMWYLDLILLKLFDYKTVYRNRLKRLCSYEEALEPVPWKK